MLQCCSEIFPLQWQRINLQSKSDSRIMLKWVVYSLMTKSMTKPTDILMRTYMAMPSNIVFLLSCLISCDFGYHCADLHRVGVTSTAELLLIVNEPVKMKLNASGTFFFCCFFSAQLL